MNMDLQALGRIVGAGAVTAEPADLAAAAVDGLLPQAVVAPQTLAQAGEVLRLAGQAGWRICPRGGGSKMSLGNPPRGVDLVLSTARLDKIIDLDVANLTVTVQAGVKLHDLQDLLAGSENRCFFPLDGDLKEKVDVMCSSREYQGAFLPLDPPFTQRATLGGITATNSTGPRRHRYGLPRDLVLGVRYVAPTGEVIGMGGKTVKNVSGYDVSKIMIGSLGCLGLIGEMTFRLLPLPQRRAALLISFADLGRAQAFLDQVLASRLLPAAVELLNQPAQGLAGAADPALPERGWRVALGLEGFAVEVARELTDLTALVRREKALAAWELDEDRAGEFWTGLADAGLDPAKVGSAPARFKGGYPLARSAEVLTAWSDILTGTGAAIIASAGAGVARVHLRGEAVPPDLTARLGQSLREAARARGGHLVVEAAPPEVKARLEAWGEPGDDFPLMKRLKAAMDPQGVLNPGRFLGGL